MFKCVPQNYISFDVFIFFVHIATVRYILKRMCIYTYTYTYMCMHTFRRSIEYCSYVCMVFYVFIYTISDKRNLCLVHHLVQTLFESFYLKCLSHTYLFNSRPYALEYKISQDFSALPFTSRFSDKFGMHFPYI